MMTSFSMLLSCMTGFVELGAVLYAIRLGWSPVSILMIALGYQGGAAALSVLPKLARRQYLVALCVAVVAGAVLAHSALGLAGAMLFLSVGLNGLRADAQRVRVVGTAAKRTSRIIGFLLAFLFEPTALVGTAITGLLVGLWLPRSTDKPVPIAKNRSGMEFAAAAMVLHQMHYFAYAYALPVLLVRTHGFGGLGASVAFAVGWTSYTITPVVFGKLPALRVVVIGHLAVTALLLSLGMTTPESSWLIGAWFLTGFGGGTVFGIRRLAAMWTHENCTNEMDVWENVGHVLGIVVAVGLVLMGASWSVLFVVAAFLAAAAAATLSLGSFRYSLLSRFLLADAATRKDR